MRRIDVFFYGLFMDEEVLKTKGVLAMDIRPAFVSGFQLRIGNRATLVTNPAAGVFGRILSISHVELERLYSEPGLQAYKPEAVMAQLANGETRAALCFNLVEPPSLQERNPEYAHKLRALAQQLDFPSEYVASIV